MDLASVLGILLTLSAVLGGQFLNGGNLTDIFQLSAAVVVLFGTVGAVLLSHPLSDIQRALSYFPRVFSDSGHQAQALIQEIVKVATIIRKEGLLAIEAEMQGKGDPLFKRTVKYIIDGYDQNAVREIIDSDIQLGLEADLRAARVFETAGSYAPAIGVIGAVLGLIQVMTLLSEPSKLGAGIAAAFTSSLYGMALAQLLLLPCATKLKRTASDRKLPKEMVKLGVLGIQEGLNPSLIQEKLEVFVRNAHGK